MDGEWTLATGPSEEPLSVAEFKAHARIDITTDDTLIGAYLTAARQFVEGFTRRALVTQTWDLYLPAWPTGSAIRLPRPPLQSVTHVKYTDSDGVQRTLAADQYDVDIYSEPGRIRLAYGCSWPSDTLTPTNPITVRFVAGYGAAAAVPEWAAQAIRFLAAHYYENREESTIAPGVVAVQTPVAAHSLMWMHRCWY